MPLTTAALIGALLMSAAGLSAATVAPPPTAGTWNIDYGVKYCALIRKPSDPLVPRLVVRSIPGTPRTEMLIVSSNWPRQLLRSITLVELAFLPTGKTKKIEAIPIVQLADGQNGIGLDIDETTLNDLSNADTVVIRRNKQQVLTIPIPVASKAIAALRSCDRALITSWGIDAKALDALAALPIPATPAAKWLDFNAMPDAIRKMKASGTVVVRLHVDDAGAITRCAVVATSDIKALDDESCTSIIKHGRYKPAIDDQGAHVAVDFVQTVQWYLGGR